MHDKTFIVDGKVAITGGRNMADEYFDYDHEYNFPDRDALVVGKVVEEVEENFNEFWSSDLSITVEDRFKCTKEELRDTCVDLVAVLREKSRFVLGITDDGSEMTHTQLMKLRCGGLLGMQRVFNSDDEKLASIREIIAKTESVYGDVEKFPFSEIMRDIKEFNHRKKMKN